MIGSPDKPINIGVANYVRPGQPHPFIVAEMGANHGGKIERALAMVELAAKAGADAIKLQTWTTDTMTPPGWTERAPPPWDSMSLVDLYRKAQTPLYWHRDIFDKARENNIVCFSTPFDRESVDALEKLNCPIYKIASFEIVDLQLIGHAASTGKPLIISTGMASQGEIFDALEAASGASVTLLACASAYPAMPSEACLQKIKHMNQLTGCPVGLSDHTVGIGVAVAAVALGATVVEKHFMLEGDAEALDKDFSLYPEEFRSMTIACLQAALAVSNIPRYGPQKNEHLGLRRSLYTGRNLKHGDVIEAKDIITARPALGLAPRLINMVVGRRLTKNAPAGTPITPDLLE